MEQLPVFVYGTLRRGQGNHHVIEDSLDGVLRARLRGYVLYGDGLPWIAPGGGPDSIVAGDLLLISPGRYQEGLRALDRLEGYRPPRGGLYVRTVVRAEVLPAGAAEWQQRDAWAYLGGDRFPRDRRLVIASGDWAAAVQVA